MFSALVAALVFPISQAEAVGLKWEATRQELTMTKGEQRVSSQFFFTNTLPSAVQIHSVQTSCGCVGVEWLKKAYEPGESGVIKVRFEPDGRRGRQEKTIIVRMTDKKIPDAVLTLHIEVPDSIKVHPEKLAWKIGDPPEPKAFEITVLEPEATTLKTVQPLGSDFQAELKKVEGGVYQVEVKPLTTERALKGRLRLDIADPKPRSIYLKVGVEE